MRFITIGTVGIFSGFALLVAIACRAAVPGVKSPPKAIPSHHCDTPLRTLKTNLGGYCRGPSKERVVVFVNGIFGDAVDTWSNGNAYWPELLAEDSSFDDTDIYVHSFVSPKVATAQEIDELAGRMSDFLVNDGIFSRHKQVVFIAHSMGGLVVRAYLVKRRPAPANVPMIYFFATPTTGANVAGVAAHLSKNPQLKYMLPIDENGYVGDLQNAWLSTSDDPRVNYPSTIASFCAYEKLDTWGFRVVTRSSATNLCNRETRGIVRDHIGIVKPASTSDDAYAAFKAAYLQTFGPLAGKVKLAILSKQQNSTYGIGAGIGNFGGSGIRPDYFGLAVFTFRSKENISHVGCHEDKTGVAKISYEIPESIPILSAVPAFDDQSDIDPVKSSIALVTYDHTSAQIRYRVRGSPDSKDGSCGSEGHANVVIYLVSPKDRRTK